MLKKNAIQKICNYNITVQQFARCQSPSLCLNNAVFIDKVLVTAP